MLKRSIIFISVVLLLFVGLAIQAPAAGAEEPAAPPPWTWWDGPVVDGKYTVKCNIKFYDWTCNKVFVIKEATWLIQQLWDPTNEQWLPKVQCWFLLKGIPDGWNLDPELELYSPNGYVGPFVRSKGRITDKPRLSQWGDDGTFCDYSSDPGKHYGTWVINAKIKVDKKTGGVKSIKGSIYGWGELGPTLLPPPTAEPGPTAGPPPFWVPTLGQFEGKFKATIPK